ncbi:hypothetical protein RIF29_04456 [Crotalaria pallida]|uniref:Uncharacterized protein n=1 Tax=Crotalaria pallida TaxID=3830 RepID=A0AAN9J1Z7_CROPI
MGSPHLIAFPKSITTFNDSHGQLYANDKKRARKDSPQVSQSKQPNGIKTPKSRNTPMQKNAARDVTLSYESNKGHSNSLSQLSSSLTFGKDRQFSSTSSKNKPTNTKPMQGFDLGTEISISPNLLRGSVTQENKEVGAGGKPPDPGKGKGGITV